MFARRIHHDPMAMRRSSQSQGSFDPVRGVRRFGPDPDGQNPET
jgi:hypothetical protein